MNGTTQFIKGTDKIRTEKTNSLPLLDMRYLSSPALRYQSSRFSGLQTLGLLSVFPCPLILKLWSLEWELHYWLSGLLNLWIQIELYHWLSWFYSLQTQHILRLLGLIITWVDSHYKFPLVCLYSLSVLFLWRTLTKTESVIKNLTRKSLILVASLVNSSKHIKKI